MAIGISMYLFDGAMTVQQAKPVQRNDFFISQLSFNMGRETLYTRPKIRFILLAKVQINRYQLILPVHSESPVHPRKVESSRMIMAFTMAGCLPLIHI